MGPDILAEDLRSWAFRNGDGLEDDEPGTALKLGLEVEAVPLDRRMERIALIRGAGPRSLLPLVRAVARKRSWRQLRGPGPPSFQTPAGDVISFEPGGQVEWASRPDWSVRGILWRLRRDMGAIEGELARQDIELIYRGMDPVTPDGSAPLQIQTDRYLRMDRHFARTGGWGRRMMRQSAAIHVNLDWSHLPALQWQAANALAPVLTAVFANSRVFEKRDTGVRSFRAVQWRRLDPERTGILSAAGPDPAPEYLDFALNAPAILLALEEEAPRPFREWIGVSGVDQEDWREHLTTLFPEVRPRGYLEIRALDALPLRWMAAPIVFLTGLLYDRDVLGEVVRLLPAPTSEALERAGEEGLRDSDLHVQARRLWELALDGASRLRDLVDPESLETAQKYASRFTDAGEDPGCE